MTDPAPDLRIIYADETPDSFVDALADLCIAIALDELQERPGGNSETADESEESR